MGKSWKGFYSSEHLESSDFDELPPGAKISVKIVKLNQGEIDEKKKMLATFEPSEKFGKICPKRTWMPAKTCGYCFEAMWGKDPDKWIGKTATLYVDTLRSGDTAIRVAGSPDMDRDEIVIKVRVYGEGRQKVTLRKTTAPKPDNAPEPGSGG